MFIALRPLFIHVGKVHAIKAFPQPQTAAVSL